MLCLQEKVFPRRKLLFKILERKTMLCGMFCPQVPTNADSNIMKTQIILKYRITHKELAHKKVSANLQKSSSPSCQRTQFRNKFDLHACWTFCLPFILLKVSSLCNYFPTYCTNPSAVCHMATAPQWGCYQQSACIQGCM